MDTSSVSAIPAGLSVYEDSQTFPASSNSLPASFPPPSNTPTIKTADDMFDEISDVDYDVFERMLEELTGIGDLEKRERNDRVHYFAKHGLGWSDIARYDCQIKKRILLCLIENPKTFFVLYNTQKGKSRISSLEIKSWANVPGKKVVAILIVDNDKSLADQTKEGLFENINSVAEVFLLSSGAKEKVLVDSIRTYVDAYAADKDGEYKMPTIVALNNDDQIKKVLRVMQHIKTKVESRGSLLRYGVVFDEADKVYPLRRSKEYVIDGAVVSFKKFLVDNDVAVHRLGFVTATDGDLLENEEYEECANAYAYPVPDGDENYRAFHHADATIKHTPHKRADSNDTYAEGLIQSNDKYFKDKITLKDGTEGHRKIIVNGGSKTASMEGFAARRNAADAYAITVNMHGVTVYRPGKIRERRSAKGVKFGELLYKLYIEFGLHDKPLYIIGRRKVDRGLGFHWAPRDGSEGLVWTDMILGRIDDKNTAVQKAGRLAGIVAQCPKYPGRLTWWTDERTATSITRHNFIVDTANSKRGNTVLQAVVRAREEVPVVVSDVQKNDNWCIPIQLVLPASLLDSDDFRLQMNKTRRSLISSILLALLPEKEQALLSGRTVWHKRSTMAPIRRIHAAYRERRGIAPGGGTVPNVNPSEHFWLDFVPEDQADMPRGTAFITYCK